MITFHMPMGRDFPSGKPAFFSKFQDEAKRLIQLHVQELLGQDALYSLKSDWKTRKTRDPRYRHISGKPAHQPLILSGEIYDNILVEWNDGAIIVKVDPQAGISSEGFDYAEYWESGAGSGGGFSGVGYLEKGVENALPDLLWLLERAFLEEMELD